MKPRLGVIGSGPIVRFHLEAARAAGFEIETIGSRPGSESTESLALAYEARPSRSWIDVVEANIDALLIAVDTVATPEVLSVALGSGVPILCEKPGAYSSDALRAATTGRDVSSLFFAYNRRHYSSVGSATEFTSTASQVSFCAFVPEASWTSTMSLKDQRDLVLRNTTHTFDLLSYLFGPLKVDFVAKADGIDGRIFSRSVIASSRTTGTQGVVQLSMGAPANFSIEIVAAGKTCVLSPYEWYAESTGMERIEPDNEKPIRRYVPTSASEFQPSLADLEFKPGFLSQMNFMRNVAQGRPGGFQGMATLADAVRALEFAEAIL